MFILRGLINRILMGPTVCSKIRKKVQKIREITFHKKIIYNLTGQCTVCLKGLNQRFLTFFHTERLQRDQQRSDEKTKEILALILAF